MQELDIESSPLTRLDADLLQVHVADGSRLAGVEVAELSLPTGAAVTLGAAAAALGLETRKDRAGHRLMLAMAKPRRIDKSDHC